MTTIIHPLSGDSRLPPPIGDVAMRVEQRIPSGTNEPVKPGPEGRFLFRGKQFTQLRQLSRDIERQRAQLTQQLLTDRPPDKLPQHRPQLRMVMESQSVIDADHLAGGADEAMGDLAISVVRQMVEKHHP